MLTRKMVRFSAVAVVGFACVIASEARAQLVSALTAPTVCDFGEGTIRIEAGVGQMTFPSDVPCPGEGASGTCSKYNYRFSSNGGNIVKSFLSVSADLDIFVASSGDGTPATIEDPSCGLPIPNVRPGNRICEQRTVRFNSTGTTIDASVIVKRSVPRVSTAGARRGGGCGESEECWNPPIARVCLIQGPGVPAAAFATTTASRTDRAANNQCDAPLTIGPDNQVLSGSPSPEGQGCGFADLLLSSLTINGAPIRSTNGAPFTFGNGTTTCYPTSNGRAICYCKNPSTPCPN